MIVLAEEDVASISVQAVLFGLYLASLAHCLRWQLVDDEGRKLRTDIHWAMLIIAVLLFIFSAIDLGIRLSLTIAAVQGDTRYFKTPGVAIVSELAWIGRLDAIFHKIVLEISSMLITDAVLIYRCWVIYARSWRIICLPILSWTLLFASSIICVYYLTPLINPTSEQSVIHALVLQYYFWIVFYFANIVTNIYATSAIVIRILKVAKDVGSLNSSRQLHNVSRILTESGILYTSTSVLSLAGAITARWAKLSTFSNLTSILNFSMAGITFNLILIRVAKDRPNTQDDGYSDTQPSNSGGVFSTMDFHSRFDRDSTSKSDGGGESPW